MSTHSILLRLALISATLTLSADAQSSACLDLADEPHHQLLYSNQDVRVFLLELPRLASTEPYCHNHPYFYVVIGESQSSTTADGHATISHDWHAGDVRFVYGPVKHVIRNEYINPYREVVVESLHRVEYNPHDGNYDADVLGGDVGGAKPTWTLSVTRGSLSATKTQLAPGADVSPQGTGQVLIALTDLELKRDRDGMPAQSLDLSAQEVRVLTGGTVKLTNAGSHSAKFITVEF